MIKQNNNKQISKYIPKNLFPTMLNVGTKIWGSFDLSDADDDESDCRTFNGW